jgi:hypothetical protein
VLATATTDLGTNDRRGIAKLDPNGTTGVGMAQFAKETVQFMLNATKLYGKKDIQFFLNAGQREKLPSAPPGRGPSSRLPASFVLLLALERVAISPVLCFLSTPRIGVCAGPMENTTITGTQSAIKQAIAAGLKATFVDMQTACVDADLHHADNSDDCDGCASHPGVQGHRGMYEAAWPVMAKVMGWQSWPQ